KHVNLNEFLQKRYLPNYLGLHVIDAVIDYVETLESGSESHQNMIKIARKTIDELEQQNKRYREALEWFSENSPHGNIADEALEESKWKRQNNNYVSESNT